MALGRYYSLFLWRLLLFFLARRHLRDLVHFCVSNMDDWHTRVKMDDLVSADSKFMLRTRKTRAILGR